MITTAKTETATRTVNQRDLELLAMYVSEVLTAAYNIGGTPDANMNNLLNCIDNADQLVERMLTVGE